MNVDITNNLNSINLLNNTTIPNLDNKYLIKQGDTMTGVLNVSDIDCNSILNIGLNSNTINLGNSATQKTINIGNVNDIVNIMGITNNIESNNTVITDKNIVLNNGAIGNSTSGLSGLNIYDNGIPNQGYITTSSDSTQFLLKPPQSDHIFKITNNPTGFYDLSTKLYVDSQDSYLQSNITNLLSQQTNLNNEISNINQVMVVKPTNGDTTTFLCGDGTFLTPSINNFLIDNSVATTKLILPNNSNQYLNGSGQWTSININDPTTKTYVDSQITNLSNIQILDENHISLLQSDNTLNKNNINSINTLLSSYSNTTQVNSLINTATSNLQNNTQVNSLINTSLLPYSTTTQINSLITTATTNLQTSTQVNSLINTS